ncbi:hypothetical protein [Bradyrhizobium sp. Gha]|uniref:hypothetical protein n=1 Tax=Bradyrhizobium sp. Gha TaxID=1855318 RepID=UPI0011604BB6|nr:hypothetical protein [Bradyrhizobium sp. Gha]
MPSHPVLALVCGIGSHFAIDAIPHADYPLRSISLRPRSGATIAVNRSLFRDLIVISLDAVVGLTVAMWLYATPTAALAVLLGAIGGMLPDPLQLAHKFYPKEPLRSLQRFHKWIHTKRRLRWPEAMGSQFLFVLLTIAVVEIVRACIQSS